MTITFMFYTVLCTVGARYDMSPFFVLKIQLSFLFFWVKYTNLFTTVKKESDNPPQVHSSKYSFEILNNPTAVIVIFVFFTFLVLVFIHLMGGFFGWQHCMWKNV